MYELFIWDCYGDTSKRYPGGLVANHCHSDFMLSKEKWGVSRQDISQVCVGFD